MARDSPSPEKKRAAQTAYKEVFETSHPDPLDPLFKEFPDGWPRRFIGLHKAWLRRLLAHCGGDQDKLRAEIVRYQTHLTTDHALQRLLPDDERRVAAGSVYESAIPAELREELTQLAHNIWALELWDEYGKEVALEVLLEDREAAKEMIQGAKNVVSTRNARAVGAERTRARILATLREDFFLERARQPDFTHICKALGAKYKAGAKHRGVKYIRGLLRGIGITGRNHKTVSP
jgi:hypothetical protein